MLKKERQDAPTITKNSSKTLLQKIKYMLIKRNQKKKKRLETQKKLNYLLKFVKKSKKKILIYSFDTS